MTPRFFPLPADHASRTWLAAGMFMFAFLFAIAPAAYFDGRMIDEVSVWSRALTQAEIRANFESAAAPSGAGLSAHWTFNTIEDAKPKDVSGNGRDLTLSGDAKLDSGTAAKDASAAP